MKKILFAIFLGSTLLPAYAGVFDDEEARKAILDLRKESRERYDTLEKNLTQTQAAANLRVEAAQRSQLELANLIEKLREEIARLRGQVEVLGNELSAQQKKTRELFTDLDERLKIVEPKKVSLDGKEALIERTEQSAFTMALEAFKTADMSRAANLFNQFTVKYPQSALLPQAYYWLGTAQYSNKEFKAAASTLTRFITAYPDNPRIADALLTLGNAQMDTGDKRSANRTFVKLIKDYPQSRAAQLAQERVAASSPRSK
jgi:tol-pal system protein YbgF